MTEKGGPASVGPPSSAMSDTWATGKLRQLQAKATAQPLLSQVINGEWFDAARPAIGDVEPGRTERTRRARCCPTAAPSPKSSSLSMLVSYAPRKYVGVWRYTGKFGPWRSFNVAPFLLPQFGAFDCVL